MTPERVLDAVRGLARPESQRALEAALAWGLPKCRTEEERLLYPALLLVLGNLNALVTPRRLEPDDLVDFHLTLSRVAGECDGAPPAPPTRTHLILRVARGGAPETPAADELWLPAEAVLAQPLPCAAQVLVRLLTQDQTS
jgi:hypothetical protein